jgi:hypothetical protein
MPEGKRALGMDRRRCEEDDDDDDDDMYAKEAAKNGVDFISLAQYRDK